MTVHFREKTDFQTPIAGNTQVHRQVAGEGKLTGQRITKCLQITQKGTCTNQLGQGREQGPNKQACASPLEGMAFERQAAVEGFHVGHTTGGKQQRHQHALGIGRSEGADVGIKQRHHLRITGGHPQSLPNRPTFAGRPHQIKTLLTEATEQLLHCGSVGPLHMNREGHLGEKLLRLPHLFNTASRQSNHQLVQALQFLEH